MNTPSLAEQRPSRRLGLEQIIGLLACPSCRGALVASDDALRCASCATSYPMIDGVPNMRVSSLGDPNADARTDTVRDFYDVAPFPGYPPKDSLGSLRARAERSEFARLLDQAVPGDAKVLEVGCGTGQMSLFLASADRVVVGADLTRASLRLASQAARRFDVKRVLFVETDLRAPALAEGAFDVVYSSGVLHHTPDPRASFRSLARLVRPGGIVVLGLYNAYARLPHRLRRFVFRMTNRRVIPFDPVLRDRKAEPARREAWLRDQYMHPEEHRHTTREVQVWFAENGIEYLRTYPDSLFAAESLNGPALFSPAADNWGFENVLSQLGWATTLAHEGGLWVTIGRRSR